MCEQQSTTIATLSVSSGLFLKKTNIAEPSIHISALVDTNLVSSKPARLNLLEQKHFYESTTKNHDVVSRKGNYLIDEDLKASQVMDIGAQVGNLKDVKKEYTAEDAASHCVLQMFPFCILHKKDPIYLAVSVVEGIAKIGTPLCIPCRGFINIGQIVSISYRGKDVDYAIKGQEVAIEVVCESGEQPKLSSKNAMNWELLASGRA